MCSKSGNEIKTASISLMCLLIPEQIMQLQDKRMIVMITFYIRQLYSEKTIHSIHNLVKICIHPIAVYNTKVLR